MTAVEYFSLLPDEIKGKLFYIIDKMKSIDQLDAEVRFFSRSYRSGSDAINCFPWTATKEGKEYWHDIALKFNDLILENEKTSYSKWEGDK